MTDDRDTFLLLVLLLCFVLLSLCYPSGRKLVGESRTYWTETLGGSHGK